ncbi:MAG TPA: carbohydrate ABC transporter permease [Lachnospiraceae bacterium]|nr:carbohydrate ABC transporter permease [Lachnospiraceae bacterium]
MISSISDMKLQFKELNENSVLINKRKKALTKGKKTILSVLKFLILIGISYVILGPIITIISHAFFAPTDVYNPTVLLFPIDATLDNFKLSFMRLDFVKTLGNTLIYIVILTLIQILITSMAGYGFARFDFPLKKLLFACVIITIVIPTHTIMLPLYQHFRTFDIFGIIGAFKGEKINLLSSTTPMYLMTLLGCGLRSGLYIYIFNQFFRGLPKEIEEAAFIDGAGSFYTYFRIMLVNAMPSVVTVSVFSLVWQYNDMFYCKLFTMPTKQILSLRLSTLQPTIEFVDQVKDPMLSQLNVYAGVILVMIPIVTIYLILQKYFMEGVERSGIVG